MITYVEIIKVYNDESIRLGNIIKVAEADFDSGWGYQFWILGKMPRGGVFSTLDGCKEYIERHYKITTP